MQRNAIRQCVTKHGASHHCEFDLHDLHCKRSLERCLICGYVLKHVFRLESTRLTSCPVTGTKMTGHGDSISISQLPSWQDPSPPDAENWATYLHRRPLQAALRRHYTKSLKCGVFGHSRILKVAGQVTLRAHVAGADALSTHNLVHSAPVTAASGTLCWLAGLAMVEATVPRYSSEAFAAGTVPPVLPQLSGKTVLVSRWQTVLSGINNVACEFLLSLDAHLVQQLETPHNCQWNGRGKVDSQTPEC
eukprot:5497826-Amphidinium_carterae.1